MNDQPGYGLVLRLAALRDLLRQGGCTKADICRQLPHAYKLNSAGSRRLGRDLRALRQLGHTINYDRPTQLYLLQDSGQLTLNPNEVQALALIRESFEGLAPKSEEVLAVLARIVAALPARQRRLYTQHTPLAIRLRPAVNYSPHRRTLQLLEDAIAQGRKVSFEYPALDDGTPVRHMGVEPYEIQFFDRHFYLIGFSPASPQIMEFRLDRLRRVEQLPGRTAARRRRTTYAFSYRLTPRIARQGVSERFLNPQVEPQADGSVIIHAEGYSEFRIVQELLRYGEQAELLGPPSLRRRMAAVARAMAQRYTDDTDK
jgi:predicted DNA-binding transcriptional regulator YafY